MVRSAKKKKKTAKKTHKKATRSRSNGFNALVIVESPAKAKTIEKYLGPGHVVKASMGHVRDLPESELGIDPANQFEPTYRVLPRRAKLIGDLAKLADRCETVYLATDLDREGEAIAWHLSSALELDPNKTQRVVFNEITKSAIQEAFANPRAIDMNKVEAQQARRVLDRLVGYELSPLLWSKIAKGLSAGRVQSVAVRLIVEREWEIREFVPSESWKITATFTPQLEKVKQLCVEWEKFLEGGEDLDTGRTQKERMAWLGEHASFEASLVKVNGSEFKARTHEQAVDLATRLGFVLEEFEERPWSEYEAHNLKIIDLAGGTQHDATEFIVDSIETKQTRGKPPAPFTTATLQQAASSQLRFSTSRTMKTAQQLYEGVEIGSEGSVGLITYMRTDSLNVSKEALGAVRDLIDRDFGKDYLPAKPNVYGNRKRAQEAHEAIRPTGVDLTPDEIKKHLTDDQFKLYRLIWKRFVACQMTPSQWKNTTVLVKAMAGKDEVLFRGSGRVLVFDGYLKVHGMPSGDDPLLPELAQDQPLAPLDIEPEQQFTSPPPRYTEASLVKALEGEGIGRPSTYATIIQTIQDRGYAEQLDRRFHATDKGEIVTEKLIAHFPKVMDVKFTSHMEDELDKIEEDHLDWVEVLNEFYEPFKASLSAAQADMEPARAEPSEYKCEQCQREMVYRWARTGRFLSCTGYPECKTAYNVDREGKPLIPKETGVKCEVCGKSMILRQSRHGSFLGCSGYPDCTHTVTCSADGAPHRLVKEKELQKPCAACGQGTMVVKRRGWRAFLGCDQYPKCKTTEPLPEGVRLERKASAPAEPAGFDCERCGKAMVLRVGKRGKFIACSGFPRCRNTKPIDQLEELRANPPAKDSGAKKAARKPIKGESASPIVKSSEEQPPPPGFAWTRTGKPTVETWPEDKLFCPLCGSEMSLKAGRWGPFYSCSGFPKCKFTANLRGAAKKKAAEIMPTPPPKPKPIQTDFKCEECGEPMVVRQSRSGAFLGCSAFPKCRNTAQLPEGFKIPEPVQT